MTSSSVGLIGIFFAVHSLLLSYFQILDLYSKSLMRIWAVLSGQPFGFWFHAGMTCLFWCLPAHMGLLGLISLLPSASLYSFVAKIFRKKPSTVLNGGEKAWGVASIKHDFRSLL